MKKYKTDLSSQEWQIIKSYFPRAKKRVEKEVIQF